MAYVIIAAITATAAVVLLEQFKFHLPRKYAFYYSIAFFVLFASLFTAYRNILNLKTISLVSVSIAIVAALLIVITRHWERKYDRQKN